MLGVILRDRIPNKVIRRRTKVVDESKLVTARISDKQLTKKIEKNGALEIKHIEAEVGHPTLWI